MTVDTIRVVLGRLEDDPGNKAAWDELAEVLTRPGEKPENDALRLLEQARASHERRREFGSVARLLEIELTLAQGQPEEAPMRGELARIYDEELLAPSRAKACYERLLELLPSADLAKRAEEFLEETEAKRGKWRELYDRYRSEADGAEGSMRANFLVSAADIACRFGMDEVAAELPALLAEAAQLDPKARRLSTVAEAALGADDAALAKVLEAVLTRGAVKDERVAAGLKAGRARTKLQDADAARTAYEQVLDLAPGQGEALSRLVAAYTHAEQWDHLVALYEDQLKGGGVRGEAELGALLQVGMVHWRMRGALDQAEPFFERVRRFDPTHAGMLEFFREYCKTKGDNARLITVLTDAQRAFQGPAEKKELAAEIAHAAEAEDNAGKAIEQYKAVLKADPQDAEARAALKRLYTQSASHAPLIDLLKHDLDPLAEDDKAGRAAVLREIAAVYRDMSKNEQGLVQTLNQILQLDEGDVTTLRELVTHYESLGRFRDLIACQQKLAEHTSDPSEKADLFRSVARRWVEQFSNVQNAIVAYEGLLSVGPKDTEAREKLRELYGKRRAWQSLYDLCELELSDADGERRVALLDEMAKLASERLDRGADAIAHYRAILEIDERQPAVFDALEKQAERDRDFPTLAQVLERRVKVTDDEQAKLSLLQKLGGVYSDRIKDAAGAARAWAAVLEISPGHAKALRVLRESYLAAADYDALEALYESQQDFDGLADFLSSSADKAAETDQKIELSFRAARVYEDKLGTPERAARSYERVLTVSPSDARAAGALVPLYEREERFSRLPALYEILLAAAEDQDQRVELLRKLVAVTGGALGDRQAALGHARTAYDLQPDHENLDALEQAARAASAWGPFVEALQLRLAAQPPLEADLARALRKKLANAFATELGQLDDAAVEYRKLVAEDPTDQDTLSEFDQLLRGAERADDLRWLFDLRVREAAPDQKSAIYEEWATLEEDVFANPSEAIRLYRAACELDAEREDLLRALARLLLAAKEYAAAAEIIERQRDISSGADRAQCEVDLALLYADRLDQPSRALDAGIRALELRPRDSDAIGVLSRLMELPDTRLGAATVLRHAYADLGDARREAAALRIMLEGTTEENDRFELHVALAEVEAERLSSPSAAFDVVLRALNERPNDVLLWDRAQDLCRRSGRPTDLAEAYRAHLLSPHTTELTRDLELELCDRAAGLHDEQLGDSEGALPYLRRVLLIDPDNERAFDRLKQVLTAAERWGELEDLFLQAVESATDEHQKITLLGEVAMVAEEVIGLPQKAIGYHERILTLDPLHTPSLDALEKLYEDEERFGDLAALLERRLESAAGDEAVDIRLYLGRLYLEQLLVPERSLSHVESILADRHDDPDARELAEKLLEIGSLRLRAGALLETVYEARDEHRSLVRMLEIRLEASDADSDRVDLLRRIGEIRDERLHDDPGSFRTFADLVPLAPEDEAVRDRLLEIGRRLGQHEKLAEVLQEASKRADLTSVKAELLMQVAGVFEGQLNAPEKAEQVYQQILGIDSDDPVVAAPAARALMRLQSDSGRYDQLCRTLEVLVKLEDDVETRKGLYERLGDIYEGELTLPLRAIDAWKARLADDPSDEQALKVLERLYEREGKHRELVDTLRRREEVATDDDERKRVMLRAASVLAAPLGAGDDDDARAATDEAIGVYRAVVDTFGADREVFASLIKLYTKAGRHQDLADILESDLQAADDLADRVALYRKLGDERRVHLSDLDGALDAYRLALDLDASDKATRASVEALLEQDEAKRGAAELLHPLYEQDQNWEKLLAVLEIESSVTETPFERVEVLEKALAVCEHQLSDLPRAYGYATRLLKNALGEDSMPDQVATLERMTAATGRYAETVDVYKAVAGEVLDGDVLLGMLLRVGELASEKLEQPEVAIEYYGKALEARPDERRAMLALERLFEQSGDFPALLDVLRRRAEICESDEERKELLFREAEILRDKLQDRPGAIEVYEAIVEVDVDPKAAAELERLYSEENRPRDRVTLYERMLEVPSHDGDSAALRVKIAKIARTELSDPLRAFDELAEALAQDGNQTEAIAELEAILGANNAASATSGDATDAEVAGVRIEPEDRARAAEMLAPIYLRRGDWQSVKETMLARLEVSLDPEERGELLRGLATLYEDQLGEYKLALEAMARLLRDDLGDRSVWAELDRLARVSSAEKRLAEVFAEELLKVDSDDEVTSELCEKTGALFADLGEVDSALKFYRRAHEYQPDRQEIFDAIDGLLIKSERHEDRVALMREALEYRGDSERVELLHRVAELEETKLSDRAAAVDTHRRVLEVDDRDVLSLDRLTLLYGVLEKHQDLAELHAMRADNAESSEAAVPYRLALAKLRQEKLADVGGAIDQLETITTEVPWNEQAIAELEQLLGDAEHKARVIDILRPIYERNDNWEAQVRLNRERLALSGDAADKTDVLRETAELLEARGGDKNAAFEAFQRAFEIDPENSQLRGDLERLAEELESWDRLATTLERGASKVDSEVDKREILVSLANTYDDRLDSPRQALQAYEQLAQISVGDPEPLSSIEELCTLLGDWSRLCEVLQARAEQASDFEAAELLTRLGRTKVEMLDDVAAGAAAYERSLELAPDMTDTLDRLTALYEASDEPSGERLVELYQRRVDLAESDEGDLRYDLSLRAAALLETKLERPRDAIGVLSGALEARPGDAPVMKRLEQLFRSEEMFDDLLDNLREQSARVEDPVLRADLKATMGDIHKDKLSSPMDALEHYRSVLDEVPTHDRSIAALLSIADQAVDLRLEATDALLPVLRNSSRHEDHVTVLGLRAGALEDAESRAQTLLELAEVLDQKLARLEDSEAALRRALADTPEDSELHDRIAAICHRQPEPKSAFGRYADTLQTQGDAALDASVAEALFVRLGKVSEEHLGDDTRAERAYASALDRGQGGERESAILESLDRLQDRLGQHRALAETLERRLAHADDTAQAELHVRLARLQAEQFDDKNAALGSLRAAIERSPEHAGARERLEGMTGDKALFEEVAETLESVYRQVADNKALAVLFGKRIQFAETDNDRLRLRLDFARMLEDQAGDPAAAHEALLAAMADDPSDSDVLAETERVSTIVDGWKSAAEALEKAVGESESLSAELVSDLYLRAAGWRKDKLADLEGAERDYERALAKDLQNEIILRKIEELQRVAGRERDLVATLRRLAALDGVAGPGALRREAKVIAETVLADIPLAEAIVREMITADETDVWALTELTELRRRQGDGQETYKLLIRRTELAGDADSVRELRYEAAQVAHEDLKDLQASIDLYELIFENTPTEQRASSALRKLYAEADKKVDLLRLLERLVDVADDVSKRVELRYETARVSDELGNTGDAIVQLYAIVDDDPAHVDAALMLSRLLEKEGRDEDLAMFLTKQIERAKGRSDKDAEVACRVRLGEVFETRIGDLDKAAQAFRVVLDENPEHYDALAAMARILEKQGEKAEAAKIVERRLQLETGETALLTAKQLAGLFDETGEREGYQRALEKGLSLAERDEDVRGKLRTLYAELAAFDKLAAIVVGDAAAAEATGDKVRLLKQAADIHATKLDSAAKAADLLKEASDLVPDDRELLLALCDAYSSSARGAQAVAVLQQIVDSYGGRRSKEVAVIHHRLARAYLADGDRPKALEELDTAFKIDPGSIAVLRDLGVLALELSDADAANKDAYIDRAQKTFKALLLQRLDDNAPITKAEVFFYLGDVSHRQGDDKKAVQMFERALDNDKNFERAKEMIAKLKP